MKPSQYFILFYKALLLHLISGWTIFFTSPSAHLLIPRRQSIKDRLNFVFNSTNSYSIILRLRIFIFILIHFTIVLPLAAYLWKIDELFFSSYQNITFISPVFLLSAPRAGTTSLHSLLAKDTETFVTPTTAEYILPFLCIQYILRSIHNYFPTTFHKIEQILKKLNGVTAEVESRHPVSLFNPDADDVLIGEWQWVAVGSIRTCPSLCHWWDHYDFHSFSEGEKKHIMEFHKKVLQKVMFHRGGGENGDEHGKRRLLVRSHLSAFFDEFKMIYKDASFIGIIRDPVQILRSFAGLSNSVVYHSTGYKMLHPSPLKMADINWKALKNESGDSNDDDGQDWRKSSWSQAFVAILSDMMGHEARLHLKIQKQESTSSFSSQQLKSGLISFEQFKHDPIKSIFSLYKSIGIILPKQTKSATPVHDEMKNLSLEYYEELLNQNIQKDHESYKERHQYINPTMKELYIDEKEFVNLENIALYKNLMKNLPL